NANRGVLGVVLPRRDPVARRLRRTRVRPLGPPCGRRFGARLVRPTTARRRVAARRGHPHAQPGPRAQAGGCQAAACGRPTPGRSGRGLASPPGLDGSRAPVDAGRSRSPVGVVASSAAGIALAALSWRASIGLSWLVIVVLLVAGV